MQARWMPARFDWEPASPRFVPLEPFRRFLLQYLATWEEESLEGIAERYVARFGGSWEARLDWLRRVLMESRTAPVNLYLVDEVMTLLGHHPAEVYGDEW